MSTSDEQDVPQPDGPPQDIGQLWSSCYEDLRVLARSRLRTSGELTLLDTTGLVNQSYLKLMDGQGAPLSFQDRRRFFAYASMVMRSIIVDIARERLSARRGGGEVLRLSTAYEEAASLDDDPLFVDNALQALAQREPRLAQIVELRFFGGLTESEIGELLGITERTVRSDWAKARVLMRMLLE